MRTSLGTEYANSIKGWSAKTGKDVGECKESIFYFLLTCCDWLGDQISISQSYWALIYSARKCSHMLGLVCI